MSRCYKPDHFGNVMKAEVHHFFKQKWRRIYSQCSSPRITGKFRSTQCSLLIGKSRVSPIKYVLFVRLKLTAAILSIKISTLIKKELVIEDYEEPYWTVSKVILCYINKEMKCFKIFKANKVKKIKYISSKESQPLMVQEF